MPRSPIKGLEITDDQETIEPVSASADFKSIAADESFMNEIVTIMVHETTDENQPPHLIVNCNGMNQPIIRGMVTQLKRKYVEILARMKETRYTQIQHAEAPDRLDLRARTALVYGFDLIEDKNPKGRAWLSHIIAEPA